jgi:hypothetical protein
MRKNTCHVLIRFPSVPKKRSLFSRTMSKDNSLVLVFLAFPSKDLYFHRIVSLDQLSILK